MTHEPREPWRPELLAGYADGELNTSDRAAAEAWLAAHPDGRAELEVQRGLSRQNVVFWKKVAVPAVGEAAWGRLLSRVKTAVEMPTPSLAYHDPQPLPPKRAALRRWSLGLVGVAAAGLAAWTLSLTPGLRTGHSDFALTVREDVFDVVRGDEVDVISLQGDDALLVVGRPPFAGPPEIVTVGDVVFDAIASDTDAHPFKPSVVPKNPKDPVLLPPIHKDTPVPVVP